MGLLPITSKLLPFRARNLAYLAEVAALTRAATGVVRVLENRPSKQKDDKLSPNEKRQALLERCFVEIFGTAAYMAFLHLGQDAVDHIQAHFDNTPIPKLDKAKLSAGVLEKIELTLKDLNLDVDRFNELIEKLYHPEHIGPGHELTQKRTGLLYRVLYEDEKTGQKATLASLKAMIEKKAADKVPEKVSEDIQKLFKQLNKDFGELEHFAGKNNVWAASAILTGVFLSATVGGSVTQWMNDYLVAPGAKKWLNKNFIAGKLKPVTEHLAPVLNPAPPLQGVKPAANDNHTLQPHAAVATTPINPFNVAASNPVLPPNPPPIAPVYLPNPKMQPPAAAFAASALPRPYTTPLPNLTFGGRS